MDIDDPVFKVEQQIREVEDKITSIEAQICGVENELRQTTDPEERRFLRTEEEQLRTEEQQLRTEEEQLRTEKEQLRNEEQLKDRLPPPTEAAVLEICEGWWVGIEEKIAYMPTRDHFKKTYRRSNGALCSIQGSEGRISPVLLLQGLDVNQHFKASTLMLSQLKRTGPVVCFVVDASGSGKTRAMYEIASKEHCIYLMGTKESTGVREGSSDLSTVSAKLASLYPRGIIPAEALTCVMAALFVARLFTFKKSLRYFEARGSTLDPLTWLFKQVYFGLLKYPVQDPWKDLTMKLLTLTTKQTHVIPALDVYRKVLLNLQEEVGWSGRVMVDEFQELSTQLDNRFLSKSGKLERSLMDKVLVAINELGFKNKAIIVSGTGRGLFRAVSQTLKDQLDVLTFSEFGGWGSARELENYTLTVISSVYDFDFERLFRVYTGRYRFYVTALQTLIRKWDEEDKECNATEFLLEFSTKLCSLTTSKSFFALPTLHPLC